MLGAHPYRKFIKFRLWAPKATTVAVVAPISPQQAFPLTKTADGFFEGTIAQMKTGDLYRYQINGEGSQDFSNSLGTLADPPVLAPVSQ